MRQIKMSIRGFQRDFEFLPNSNRLQMCLWITLDTEEFHIRITDADVNFFIIYKHNTTVMMLQYEEVGQRRSN